MFLVSDVTTYAIWYLPKHWRTFDNWLRLSKLSVDSRMNSFTVLHIGLYGKSLNVWDWKQRKLIQTIDLGSEGFMPLEIRFLHDPSAKTGFVGCALTANVFRYRSQSVWYIVKQTKKNNLVCYVGIWNRRFHQLDNGEWTADKVIDIPSWKVSNWALPEMPGIITDILISLDDRFLYMSNWVQGIYRRYDMPPS